MICRFLLLSTFRIKWLKDRECNLKVWTPSSPESQYIFLLQAVLGEAWGNEKQLIGWQWKRKPLLFSNLPWIPEGKYCFLWRGKKIDFSKLPCITIRRSSVTDFVRVCNYFNKRTETCIFILFPLVQRMDFHFLYKQSQLSKTLIYCSKES